MQTKNKNKKKNKNMHKSTHTHLIRGLGRRKQAHGLIGTRTQLRAKQRRHILLIGHGTGGARHLKQILLKRTSLWIKERYKKNKMSSKIPKKNVKATKSIFIFFLCVFFFFFFALEFIRTTINICIYTRGDGSSLAHSYANNLTRFSLSLFSFFFFSSVVFFSHNIHNAPLWREWTHRADRAGLRRARDEVDARPAWWSPALPNEVENNKGEGGKKIYATYISSIVKRFAHMSAYVHAQFHLQPFRYTRMYNTLSHRVKCP